MQTNSADKDGNTLEQVELIVSLLALVGIIGAVSHKLKIASPLLLVVVGMIISVIPQIPDIILEPKLIFFLFLPPLLYADAFTTHWKELRDVADAISFQAVGLVLVTVAAVAAAIHAVVPGMPWPAAFVLGAIVSPTDAVAASALSEGVQFPKRVLDIIKGESLINDATGLVAYQFAVAATVTGAFSWSDAGIRFLYVSIVGVLTGLVVGWLLSKLRTKLDDTPVEMIASLVSPFLAYLVAEHLHASGVLSVVTAGLLLGWYAPRMQSSQARIHLNANWDGIVYILNGMSFLLMGLQLEPVLRTIESYPANQLLIWTLTAALAPVLIRFAWIFTIAPLYSLTTKRLKPTWKQMFVLSWSGMRGVVSLAAALAVPLTCANGQSFPYRNLILFLTLVVIASTLLLQGLLLPFIVKRLNFVADHSEAETSERKARSFLSREAIRAMDAMARQQNIDLEHPTVQRLINRHLELAFTTADQSEDAEQLQALRRLEAESIACQRSALIGLRESDQIKDELFRRLEAELDLEEERLKLQST